MIFNKKAISGFSSLVATLEKQRGHYNIDIIINGEDDSGMYKPGFYFFVDKFSGEGLNMYSLGRIRVSDKYKTSCGLYSVINKITNPKYRPSAKLKRHLDASTIEIYYVSMQDAKYLTNKIGKQGTLFGKLAKTETDIYNNMYEVKTRIKEGFSFKYN
ncbi:nucleoid disruption protein [Shigella phage vB_SdyM_006]|nr:nucleoid disruption protein [Shigella phage vB_SdyM_006]